MELFDVDRRVRPTRRGDLGDGARRVLRRAHHRPARHGRYGLPRPGRQGPPVHVELPIDTRGSVGDLRRFRRQPVPLAAGLLVGRWWPGRYRRRLPALRRHVAQRRRTRRSEDHRPQDARVHDDQPPARGQDAQRTRPVAVLRGGDGRNGLRPRLLHPRRPGPQRCGQLRR